MKHYKINNLIHDLQQVKMTSEEKSDVLRRTLSVIDTIEAAHSLSIKRVAEVPAIEVSVSSSVKSAWYSYFIEKKFVPALTLSLLLLTTGGTSLAAESALPGDILYSVKVGLNEKVRGFTAITPEAKAKFALEVTDRRLKEVALLSSKGLLNDETSSIIQSELLKQAGQIRNQVASLVSTKNIKAAQEISLNFESSLRAHELILEKISKKQSGETDSETALAVATSTDASVSLFASAPVADAQQNSTSSEPTLVAVQARTLSTNPHIDSVIQTLRMEIATTTISRTQLQQAEIQELTKESLLSRIKEMRLKAIGIKRVASTTPIASSVRASTTLGYIAQTDSLIESASIKVASSSLADALFDIQRATQFLIDAETLLLAESAADPSLKALVNEALSVSSLSPVLQTPTASSSGPVASTTATTTSSSIEPSATTTISTSTSSTN